MIGTPQGSILSPILANIYLHELDTFMEDKVKESEYSGKTSRPFKPYLQIHSKILAPPTIYRRMNKGYIPDVWLRPGVRLASACACARKMKELHKLIVERGKLRSTIGGPGYRIYYVRYADDFLIGINGSRKLTLLLKEEINNFLSQNLKLLMSVEKTRITDAKKEKALFLGTEILRPNSRTNDSKVIHKRMEGRSFVSRIPASRLALCIPIERVVRKLENQQFCVIKDYDQGQIIPKGKVSWINLSLREILLKYNAVMQGLANYYSFADNRARLQLIQFILLHSCAKLFGRKLKLRTRSKVFTKFGKNLKITEDGMNEKKKKTFSFKLSPS
jgi:Type II intron maturase